MPKSPRILDIEMAAIERVLERANALLPPEDVELLRGLLDTLLRLTKLVRERGTSIARLRRLFGLSGSEKSRDISPSQPDCADPSPAPSEASTGLAQAPSEASTGLAQPEQDPSAIPPVPAPPAKPAEKPPIKKRKGHGRMPAAAYLAARHINVAHPSLRAGNPCPKCDRGNLHRLNKPAPIVRIVGSPPLVATCWDCERLRCATCGALYTARAPEEAQGEKYDETAASIISLLRYGAGTPFNRLEHLQKNLDTPVPSSTQWDIVNQRVELVRPVFNELVRLAAQGNVLHNDDSYVRILEFMGKRRADLLAKGKLPDPERTGLFTTAIVAVVAAVGAIALFFTGRKHAGENLALVLKQRAADLPPPIQMGDALSRNLPKGHQTKESNCIAHGRRQIFDEIENYPAECHFLLQRLALVYKIDDDCKIRGLSDGQRLVAHQHKSAPLMDELRKSMASQLDEKKIEPNSGLGHAFNYFLKRWDKFTLFLREPGAPLDNNICERALKMAIKNRNNSLFYRSQRGAQVGDTFMTLIHTAELHGQNPYDYLTAIQRNYKAVAENPADWLPWNYKETLARMLANRPTVRASPLADVDLAA